MPTGLIENIDVADDVRYTQHHAMKTWGTGGRLTPPRTPAALPRERSPFTHWTGAEYVPGTVWTLWTKDKSYAPAGNRSLIRGSSSP